MPVNVAMLNLCQKSQITSWDPSPTMIMHYRGYLSFSMFKMLVKCQHLGRVLFLTNSPHLEKKKKRPWKKKDDKKDKWTGALTGIVVVHTSPVSTMFAASVCSPSVIHHHCVFHWAAHSHQCLCTKLAPKQSQNYRSFLFVFAVFKQQNIAI